MRQTRLMSIAVVIALSAVLTGCGGGGMSGFDPSDMLDFLDTKKKLPGDRKPVFPGGVPGLEQGVPKNLYRGSQQEQIDQQNAAAAAQPPQPVQKRGTKARSRPAAASAAPVEIAPDDAVIEEGSTAAAPPPPKQAKQSRRRVTTPPPDQPAAQPQAQQQTGSSFPAPLPGGSFQR